MVPNSRKVVLSSIFVQGWPFHAIVYMASLTPHSNHLSSIVNTFTFSMFIWWYGSSRCMCWDISDVVELGLLCSINLSFNESSVSLMFEASHSSYSMWYTGLSSCFSWSYLWDVSKVVLWCLRANYKAHGIMCERSPQLFGDSSDVGQYYQKCHLGEGLQGGINDSICGALTWILQVHQPGILMHWLCC